MIKLHEAVNRVLFQLLVISPSESQYERLEKFHRKGLRVALGVPKFAASIKVLHEARLPPLHLHGMGINITFQWIPSHVGIAGSEAADRLARSALELTPTKKALKDNQRKPGKLTIKI
ncbi:uncharacterized protein LOC142784469 [Rhipicephalus microplus]|uniref:uncharacterized protein LOC142784469 n=1 Tax=Rhipicephalus microplus TaxID=6941 RepID=UPI003F6AA367